MTTITDKLLEAGTCHVATVSGAIDRARTALAAAGDDLVNSASFERARARAEAVNGYAHKSPWTVVAGIALFALALGLALKRR